MRITFIHDDRITVNCTLCGNAVEHPFATMTLTAGAQDIINTGKCPTPTCNRVTFIPRQMPGDDPAEWQTNHNRAMNAVHKRAIDAGCTVNGSAPDKNRIATEKGKNPKRFAAEEWRDFGPGKVAVTED